MRKVSVSSFSGHINSLFRNLWASGKSVRENEVVFTRDEWNREISVFGESGKMIVVFAWYGIIHIVGRIFIIIVVLYSLSATFVKFN